MGKTRAARVEQAESELAQTLGFSRQEREAIIALVSVRTLRNRTEEHAYARVLRQMGARDFGWPEFDRWYGVFSKRGMFPPLWEGLEYQPCPAAADSIRQAYHEQKLYLLIDWLQGLEITRAEMRVALARYAKLGVSARITRQGEGSPCPTCDPLNHRKVNAEPLDLPPFHPGCRCLILAERRN
jgi:hypothetical protein